MERRKLLPLVLLVISAIAFSVAAYWIKTKEAYAAGTIKPLTESEILHLQSPESGNLSVKAVLSVETPNASMKLVTLVHVYYAIVNSSEPVMLMEITMPETKSSEKVVIYNSTIYYCSEYGECYAKRLTNYSKESYNLSYLSKILQEIAEKYKDVLKEIKVKEYSQGDYRVYEIELNKTQVLQVLSKMINASKNLEISNAGSLAWLLANYRALGSLDISQLQQAFRNLDVRIYLKVFASKDSNQLRKLILKVLIANQTTQSKLSIEILANLEPISKEKVYQMVKSSIPTQAELLS